MDRFEWFLEKATEIGIDEITPIICNKSERKVIKIEKWGLLIIIAGAISNIVDRALNDYVLDFIHLQYNNYYWPAFNFADIYITIGVLLILYKVVIDLKKK